MLATVRRSLSCAAAVTAVVLALMILLATAPPLATRADALTVPHGERVGRDRRVEGRGAVPVRRRPAALLRLLGLHEVGLRPARAQAPA